MLALSVPWLLTLLFIVTILLLFKKKWGIAIIFSLLIFTLNWWGECIPLRLYKKTPSYNKNLRVLSFNIEGTVGDYYKKESGILKLVRQHSPDIVFLAEYNEQYANSMDSLLRKEYAYSTFPDRLLFQYFYGRYPFINNRRLKGEDGNYLGVYACSVVIQKDTIDLYGCHLASNNYNQRQEREGIEDLGQKIGIMEYIHNIQSAGLLRSVEVGAIVREISKSSHSSIVMGDMNDVCGSSVLKELETIGLVDAWWEGGFGYGATIHKPLPYRIDHIMHTNGLKLQNIKVLDSNGISDHDALYAEFN